MLAYVTLAIASLTFVVIVSRGRGVSRLQDEVRQLGYLEGSLRELRKEIDLKLQLTRRHLSQVSSGKRLAPDMILEGKPFADVSGDEGRRMLEADPSLLVLDVRTPSEFASGHIPGARLVPITELEARMGELPDRSATMLVTCAGGTRSAAACAMLAERGFASLYNLQTGMSGWRGPVERGAGQ